MEDKDKPLFRNQQLNIESGNDDSSCDLTFVCDPMDARRTTRYARGIMLGLVRDELKRIDNLFGGNRIVLFEDESPTDKHTVLLENKKIDDTSSTTISVNKVRPPSIFEPECSGGEIMQLMDMAINNSGKLLNWNFEELYNEPEDERWVTPELTTMLEIGYDLAFASGDINGRNNLEPLPAYDTYEIERDIEALIFIHQALLKCSDFSFNPNVQALNLGSIS